MKTVTVILAAACLAGLTARAQEIGSSPARPYFSSESSYAAINPEKVEKAYISCLKTDNQGVVESALAHAAWMKLMMPDVEFSNLKCEINRLAVSADSPAIRTQAYLTALVFEHTELFANVTRVTPQDAGTLFSTLNNELRNVLLSYDGRKYVR